MPLYTCLKWTKCKTNITVNKQEEVHTETAGHRLAVFNVVESKNVTPPEEVHTETAGHRLAVFNVVESKNVTRGMSLRIKSNRSASRRSSNTVLP